MRVRLLGRTVLLPGEIPALEKSLVIVEACPSFYKLMPSATKASSFLLAHHTHRPLGQTSPDQPFMVQKSQCRHKPPISLNGSDFWGEGVPPTTTHHLKRSIKFYSPVLGHS
ncbi:hypothetical protein J6590_017247 [Homalodisca vitripennis]|nr:hypothetical protein J6590_017247 [Homalodisca vitripennis]